jgi:hypothetical protein
MSKKLKYLLIIEAAPAIQIPRNSDGDYVFEGVFGEIGIKNKNGRTYDASEYCPQILALQDKINDNTLLGELDHPQNFEVSLSKASHVIEKLEYNKETKKVIGRIRLLNTSNGKEAQALAEGGIPLHISSRAAGVVEANGHVRMKKLFTYDLVADPGFENAQLKRVNEQYGFSNDENINVYEVPETFFTDRYIKENNLEHMEDNKFVSTPDFEKWSKYISKELTDLKVSLKEGKTESGIDYSEAIAKKVNQLYEYMNYIGGNVYKLISHNNYLTEGLNNVKNYSSHIGEGANKSIEFNNYLSETLETVVKHLNYVAEKTNQSINFGEYQGAELEKAIKYIEHVATGSNKIKEYAKYLGESSNDLAIYTNYLGEGFNNHVNFTEYLKENIETVGNYSDIVGKKFNSFVQKTDPISESLTTINTIPKNYKEGINEKLEKILESAKKQTVEGNMHFMHFLSKEKQDGFYALDAEKQTVIVKAFEGKQYFNSKQADNIYNESLIIEKKDDGFDFIRNMDSVYRESWDKLSSTRKNQIIAESKYQNLNTQYQINNFWQTRDLRESKIVLEKVNESKTPVATEESVINTDKAQGIISAVRRMNNIY